MKEEKKYKNGFIPIQILVNPNEWHEFKCVCMAQKMTIREVMNSFIKDYVEEMQILSD